MRLLLKMKDGSKSAFDTNGKNEQWVDDIIKKNDCLSTFDCDECPLGLVGSWGCAVPDFDYIESISKLTDTQIVTNVVLPSLENEKNKVFASAFDPELHAMADIWNILLKFDVATRDRMVGYLQDRV